MESRQITAEEMWQITCHEAGHAVIAVRLQVPFERAVRGGGEKGEVEVGITPAEHPDRVWSRETISQWQLFYTGGAAAEILLFGKYREYAAERDRYLHGRLEELLIKRRAGGWQQDIESALRILDHDSIHRVAMDLNRCGELTEEQVYALFDRKPPWW
jgi:hypothetical protein